MTAPSVADAFAVRAGAPVRPFACLPSLDRSMPLGLIGGRPEPPLSRASSSFSAIICSSRAQNRSSRSRWRSFNSSFDRLSRSTGVSTMPGHMSPRRRMKTPSSGQCPRFCPCYQEGSHSTYVVLRRLVARLIQPSPPFHVLRRCRSSTLRTRGSQACGRTLFCSLPGTSNSARASPELPCTGLFSVAPGGAARGGRVKYHHFNRRHRT